MTERINGQGFRPADAAGTRRTDAAKPKSAESSTGPSASSTAQTGETVNLTRSTLCNVRETSTQTWSNANAGCYTGRSGASLCTHQQARHACNHGGVTLVGGSWLADRTADDQAVTVNGADCNNFDGTSGALAETQAGYYCCLEWMKY